MGLLGMVAGLQVVSFFPNTYTSKAYFIIEKDYDRVIRDMANLPLRPVLEKIVERHKLIANPEFNPLLPRDQTILAGWLRDRRAAEIPVQTDSAIKQIAARRAAAKFHSAFFPEIKTVAISFQSFSPGLSRAITQNIADAYEEKLVKTFGYGINHYDNSGMDCSALFQKKENRKNFPLCIKNAEKRAGKTNAITLIEPHLSKIPDPHPITSYLLFFMICGAMAGVFTAVLKK